MGCVSQQSRPLLGAAFQPAGSGSAFSSSRLRFQQQQAAFQQQQSAFSAAASCVSVAPAGCIFSSSRLRFSSSRTLQHFRIQQAGEASALSAAAAEHVQVSIFRPRWLCAFHRGACAAEEHFQQGSMCSRGACAAYLSKGTVVPSCRAGALVPTHTGASLPIQGLLATVPAFTGALCSQRHLMCRQHPQ